MKKTVFLLFFVSLISVVSSSAQVDSRYGSIPTDKEVNHLKLRASSHPEFLRIVLEGTEPIISRGMVNQRGEDILVRFPYVSFIIQEEKASVSYRINEDIIVFSPGNFSKFRAFSLTYPSRLVIDVYLETEKNDSKPSIDVFRKPQKRVTEPPVKFEHQKKTSHIYPESGSINKIKTVIIDPGHGGYDTGIIAEDYKEKNVVLDIAKRLKALIDRGSAKCFLTRESDQFMALEERVKFANNREAQIFLSLHIGKHNEIVLYTPVITGPVPLYIRTFLVNKGQEDFMSRTASLSNAIQKAIIEDFGDEMVSIKPLPYSILSRIEAAALIIELPSFDDAYYIAELNKELANTIYKGIYLYEEETATN